MELLEELEQELKIVYPEIYKKLFASGMLDWGIEGNGWYTNVFPKLKENPPLLLFGADIEIWDPIEYKGGIAEILHHEVYDINEKFKLVPFAKNGAGDLYVFQYDLEQNGEIPISFFPHDETELEVQAKNFQDFIFRKLLESLTEMDEYFMFDDDTDEKIKQHLNNQLRTHRPFLKENQIALLEDIYARDIFEYEYKTPNGSTFETRGLVTYDEVEEILKQEIYFEYLDKTFDYTQA